MERISGHYSTFIVRIWNEAEGKIRGHVQHTSTQDYIYFDSAEDMSRFILQHLRLPPNGLNDQDYRNRN